MSLNKTLIDWVKNPDGTPGYTWNPLTGCLNHTNGMCKGGNFPCYAYRLAHTRLRERYLANSNTSSHHKGLVSIEEYETQRTDPFYPRFWPEKLEQIKRPPYPFTRWVENAPMTREWAERQPPNFHARRKQVGVFVCSMSDLFGIGVPEEWTRKILEAILVNSVDRFYLLTKQPQNLIKFSPFPSNCWVGVTATNTRMALEAGVALRNIDARLKYLSLEPMLASINLPVQFLIDCGIDWLIIGAQTRPIVMPEISWVKEIVGVADKAGVKVFLKDNLEPLWTLENRIEPFFKFTRPSPGATEIGRLRQVGLYDCFQDR